MSCLYFFLWTHSLFLSLSETLSILNWDAMKEEMLALKQSRTRDFAVLLPGKRVVGRRCLYTMKLNLNGSLTRLKARLAAKGYS